jgi:predicted ATP-grasp superfamily ATP-dependent carboligase
MRSSLAVIRSLGKKDLNVIAGEKTRFATGFYSKYCKRRIVYPSPSLSSEKFIKKILDILKKNNFNVLFPVANESIYPIVKNKDELSKYTKIPLPSITIFMKAYDKKQTLRIAKEINIPCPKTYFVNNIKQIIDLKKKLEYPLIIKPSISYGSRGVKLCNSYKELIYKYKNLSLFYNDLMIQEYIPSNEEIGVYTIFDFNSKPCAVTVQKRLRSYPVSGGPSTLRKTIKNDDVIELAFKLLKKLHWTGVAMVEFRIDSKDKKPKLMEVNPRFWGSLQLSIISGVDFPYLLYKLMMEGKLEKNLFYKKDVICRWMLPGDLFWYFSAPCKLKNLDNFIKFKTNYDIISFNDFGPTIGFFFASARYFFDTGMWKYALR